MTHANAKDPWQEMLKRFNEAARRLSLDEGVWKILSEPDLELKVSIPVVMDSGKVEVFTGYRVQHNLAMGPCKGGIRYDSNVNLSEVKAQRLAVKTSAIMSPPISRKEAGNCARVIGW